MASEWYVRVMGDVIGPMQALELREMAQGKRLATTDEVRRGAEGRWTIAGDVSGLFAPSAPQTCSVEDAAMDVLGTRAVPQVRAAQLAAPAVQQAAAAQQTKPCSMCREPILVGAKKCKHCGSMLGVQPMMMTPERSRGLALALCSFPGLIGAHRFYTGHYTTGVVMAGLTLSVAGLFVSGPWWLYDMYQLCTGEFEDAEGRVLK